MDDVVVTTGSSGGFLLTFLSCFDVGDRVAISSPGYPCYRNILSALGCEVVEIECGPETRFQPTAQMLAELDPPVQGVIVASPANPTGTVIPPAELAAIASWCDDSGVRLISDEVYHGLVYPGAPADQLRLEHVAKCRCGQQLFQVFRDDGLAAGLAAGAVRVAPGGGPPDRKLHHLPAGAVAVRRGRGVHPGSRSKKPTAICTSTRANRTTLLDGLRGIGIDRLAPTDGAFYVYADVSDFTDDSMDFCSKLLADTGVAIAPGIDFDPEHGGSFVRLSFAGPANDIEEALRRMDAWLPGQTGSGS